MTREPEIRELAAQPAAVEHAVTDAAGLPAIIDRAFPALFGRLSKLGITPSGPPFIRYLEAGERLEIQLGVPVSSGAGELEGTEAMNLPAGRAAVLRHIGSYQSLHMAFEQLKSWLEARGEVAAGPYWEVYVTDPRTESDASKWITDICQPLG
jgi:AraC family transcriptional regulator